MLCGWEVTAGLVESNSSLLPGGWLIVTCGLTVCTSRSAMGPTLGNEYGKPLPFLCFCVSIVTHANGSCEGRVGIWPSTVCVSVFPHEISKTDAARITKLNTEMFHHKSWKPIYFDFKRSKLKVTSHKMLKIDELCSHIRWAPFYWRSVAMHSSAVTTKCCDSRIFN